MDKRYQVFISSTYTDLRDERRAVLEALLQLDAIPSGMELFPAADEDAWSLIQRIIDDSDYYLLLIGGRYGSVDADGVSFTEKEYDYAIETGKPIMAFVHGAPDKIEAGKSELGDQARAKLEAFREKVMTAKHVRKWTNGPDDLAGQVAFSFSALLRQRPAVGWVRADALAAPEAVLEVARLQAEVAELRSALDTERHSAPSGAETLAQGADEFPLVGEFTYVVDPDAEDREGNALDHDTAFDAWTMSIIWNDLFRLLGPRLLNEASESDLQGLVLNLLESSADDALIHFHDAMKKIGFSPELVDAELDSVVVSRKSFDQIVVQLLALGLMAKSDRPHGVNDRNTYWSLTPHGETVLLSLTAIRRDDQG